MSEDKRKDPSLLKRWKQAIGHFIEACLYGDHNPLQAAQARRRRADVAQQVNAEEELLRERMRNQFPHG